MGPSRRGEANCQLPGCRVFLGCLPSHAGGRVTQWKGQLVPETASSCEGALSYVESGINVETGNTLMESRGRVMYLTVPVE